VKSTFGLLDYFTCWRADTGLNNNRTRFKAWNFFFLDLHLAFELLLSTTFLDENSWLWNSLLSFPILWICSFTRAGLLLQRAPAATHEQRNCYNFVITHYYCCRTTAYAVACLSVSWPVWNSSFFLMRPLRLPSLCLFSLFLLSSLVIHSSCYYSLVINSSCHYYV